MKETLTNCERYLEYQSHLARYIKAKDTRGPKPFVTISRETGSGALTVANKLAQYLQEQNTSGPDQCPWTVFSKNIVEKVIEEHNLPQKFAPFLNENEAAEMDDILDELFGVRPSKWSLVHKISETILHLAGLGNVIIVGRGANVITRKFKTGLHVRLVGSLEVRTKHIQEFYRLDAAQAAQFVKRKDRERSNYLKKYFNKDIHDALLYDLVINTDTISYDHAAVIIKTGLSRLPVCSRESVPPFLV